jgi:GAF domain-containing protein
VSEVPTLDDVRRLADLESSGLVDSPPEEAFDRLTRTVIRALGVPVSLVSLVDDERQFFKSEIGLADPWAAQRGTGLSHSFCQHVVAGDATFTVSDARADDRVRGSSAVEDLDVVGYAGAPVHGPAGRAIGALCAITHEPREWTPQDVQLLQDLANAASDMIAMRGRAEEQRAVVADLSHHLRTGLTALRLEAQELQAGAEPGQTQERIAQLVDTLTRHSQLLDQTVQAAVAAGQAHETEVDLLELLQDTAARRSAAASSGGRSVAVLDDGARVTLLVPLHELAAVVDGMVQVLLDHGHGDVVLRLVTDVTTVRVRVSDDSQGLPSEVSTALSRRSDSASSAGDSLAERAVRCGGRLLLRSSTPTTLDLLLPRS